MLNHNEFINSYTRLQYLDLIPEIRLFLRDDYLLHSFLKQELNNDTPFPFWAYVWSGGIAMAKFILDNPEIVKDKKVVDFCSGSGIVGIAASMAGAKDIVCVDIDPLSNSACLLNARANKIENLQSSTKLNHADVYFSGDPEPNDEVFDLIKKYNMYIGCPIRRTELVENLLPIKKYSVKNIEFPNGVDTFVFRY